MSNSWAVTPLTFIQKASFRVSVRTNVTLRGEKKKNLCRFRQPFPKHVFKEDTITSFLNFSEKKGVNVYRNFILIYVIVENFTGCDIFLFVYLLYGVRISHKWMF